MSEEDKARVLMLAEEIQSLMPQLTSLLVTDDMFLLAPYELIAATMDGLGIEEEVAYDEAAQLLMDYDGDDSDNNGNGGLLQ
jgi:hypothetical protein